MVDIHPSRYYDPVLDRGAGSGLCAASGFPQYLDALALSHIVLFFSMDADRIRIPCCQSVWCDHIGHIFHEYGSDDLFLLPGGARTGLKGIKDN